jgi:hypothetical protein
MRTYALGARELTRRLVAKAIAENGATGATAHAHRTACEQVCRELSRSLGAAGFHALLTRSLAQAEAEYPLLSGIRVGCSGEWMLDGLDDLIAQNGARNVDTALEHMLATMLGLLGRLIGDDMVQLLLEQMRSGAPDDQDPQGSESRYLI